jgi:hypothetical protein
VESLLEAARQYARRGWSLIPINPCTKKPCVDWKKYQTERASEEHLDGWFGKDSYQGVAVICGPVSGGLTVRDFDRQDAYREWASRYPGLAMSLPTVRTKRGFHVYFRSTSTSIKPFDDGELRGNGICVLPPSKHPSGCIYRWVISLPEGDLPVVDPFAGGLAEPLTERTEDTETQRHGETEDTEAIASVSLSSSVLSVIGDDDETRSALLRAIVKTLPRSEGNRNWCVFQFARHLWAIPALADLELKQLRPIVEEWHRLALPTIGTKPFDDTWKEFTYAWPRVKFPVGDDRLAAAVRAAEAEPLTEVAKQYECPKTQKLVAICAALQKLWGDSPFFLSCRKAGELVGLSHDAACKLLGMLVADEVLTVAQEPTVTRATRYRYLLAEVELGGHQQ